MPPAHTPLSPPKSPPLPPSLPNELLNLVQSLTRRLDDVNHHQLPQLAACQGPLSLHNELAANVRSELAGAKADFEELKLQVDDLDRARDRAAGSLHVTRIQFQLDKLTKLYRDAVLSSKRAIEALGPTSFTNQRDELLYQNGHGRDRSSGLQPSSADDAVMANTAEVTDGLRRTMQLMQNELDRSLESNELLGSQTATMKMTSEQYSTFSTLLHTSKALITQLEKADWMDRLILLFALVFFGLVCATVVKRRILDKGLRFATAAANAVSAGRGKEFVVEGAKGVFAGEGAGALSESVASAALSVSAPVAAAVTTLAAGVAEAARKAAHKAAREAAREVDRARLAASKQAREKEVEAVKEAEKARPTAAPVVHEVVDDLDERGFNQILDEDVNAAVNTQDDLDKLAEPLDGVPDAGTDGQEGDGEEEEEEEEENDDEDEDELLTASPAEPSPALPPSPPAEAVATPPEVPVAVEFEPTPEPEPIPAPVETEPSVFSGIPPLEEATTTMPDVSAPTPELTPEPTVEVASETEADEPLFSILPVNETDEEFVRGESLPYRVGGLGGGLDAMDFVDENHFDDESSEPSRVEERAAKPEAVIEAETNKRIVVAEAAASPDPEASPEADVEAEEPSATDRAAEEPVDSPAPDDNVFVQLKKIRPAGTSFDQDLLDDNAVSSVDEEMSPSSDTVYRTAEPSAEPADRVEAEAELTATEGGVTAKPTPAPVDTAEVSTATAEITPQIGEEYDPEEWEEYDEEEEATAAVAEPTPAPTATALIADPVETETSTAAVDPVAASETAPAEPIFSILPVAGEAETDGLAEALPFRIGSPGVNLAAGLDAHDSMDENVFDKAEPATGATPTPEPVLSAVPTVVLEVTADVGDTAEPATSAAGAPVPEEPTHVEDEPTRIEDAAVPVEEEEAAAPAAAGAASHVTAEGAVSVEEDADEREAAAPVPEATATEQTEPANQEAQPTAVAHEGGPIAAASSALSAAASMASALVDTDSGPVASASSVLGQVASAVQGVFVAEPTVPAEAAAAGATDEGEEGVEKEDAGVLASASSLVEQVASAVKTPFVAEPTEIVVADDEAEAEADDEDEAEQAKAEAVQQAVHAEL